MSTKRETNLYFVNVRHVLKDCGGDYDEAAARLAQLVLDYHKMKLEKKKYDIVFVVF
jgi:hypothetical protein